jgi:hypothetical protein
LPDLLVAAKSSLPHRTTRLPEHECIFKSSTSDAISFDISVVAQSSISKNADYGFPFYT